MRKTPFLHHDEMPSSSLRELAHLTPDLWLSAALCDRLDIGGRVSHNLLHRFNGRDRGAGDFGLRFVPGLGLIGRADNTGNVLVLV
jgi:hypothetical protein